MAFNPENKQIKKALQKEEQIEPKDKLVIPVFNDEDAVSYTHLTLPTN